MDTITDERLIGTDARRGDEEPHEYRRRVERERDRTQRQGEGMRELLALVEEHGLAFPDVFVWSFSPKIDATWQCGDRETFRAVTKALGSTVDNPWRKLTNGGNYRLQRDYSTNLAIEIKATWGTCEQVQVGTKVEERDEIVRPAETKRVVEEVPVFEWQCPDSVLLGELDSAARESGAPALPDA